MLCIAGKNDIAVEILQYAAENYKGDIYAIPNEQDIGVDIWQKSLKKAASELQIPILDSFNKLYSNAESIILSLECDKLLNVRKFNSNSLYNIHFSLLPKYKGMYTSAWPILNNEKYSGVTLHFIDSGIDTGDIIDQVKFQIEFEDTARDLYFKYIKHGIELVKKNWGNIINKSCEAFPQDKLLSSYYSKDSINYRNLNIDLNQCAVNIYNQIRAYSFQEFQLPHIDDKIIVKAAITNQRSKSKAGTIKLDSNHFLISTIDYDVICWYKLKEKN